MKRGRGILLIGSLLLFGFVGCGSQQASNADRNENQPQEERLSVYASFYPMYDFAVKIGGDKADVTNLVPAGAEPHDWEPAAADVAGLEEADVFIYNGAGMEHWAADILESLQNETLIAAEASRGITLMEGHHDHEEDEGEEEPEEEEGYDPHVWLSPMNAKAEMRNITDAFAQADPDSRDYYETNYATYAAELDALDQAFRETLAPLPNKDIIVAHQAFGYLCADYGLNQVPIEGLSPDSEPDPVRMAEIIDFAEEHHVKVIFFETLASPKVAETIANAIGAETDVLSPIEGLSDEEQAAGDDYFSVMRRNLESLKAALQ